MLQYFSFSIAIAFISWIVGMILNAMFAKTDFYQAHLLSLNFIKNEQLNALLGLEPFKWIIMHSFFKYLNPKLSIKKKIVPAELAVYRAEMTLAELNHLFAFAFMLLFVAFKLFQGLYLFALVLLVVNVLTNLYPSLLQQQNKRRIDRYMAVLQRRSVSA
ncbi:hypothetical protein C7T94_11290 [Pedobacter yulinensis]|uniref:Glycosyl-4,4'-diaponeurosporenoate acyltransferase n=1 Tax=Pedobacter yulinensis TaxID=2126353 RepID=A0A2T3HL80_9SPHI|nr:hypothetical protein [Pedobacter yulinensis]PST83176.1 hypothetical protein C7T94_11290 [Pedobacter yulinensis]